MWGRRAGAPNPAVPAEPAGCWVPGCWVPAPPGVLSLPSGGSWGQAGWHGHTGRVAPRGSGGDHRMGPGPTEHPGCTGLGRGTPRSGGAVPPSQAAARSWTQADFGVSTDVYGGRSSPITPWRGCRAHRHPAPQASCGSWGLRRQPRAPPNPTSTAQGGRSRAVSHGQGLPGCWVRCQGLGEHRGSPAGGSPRLRAPCRPAAPGVSGPGVGCGGLRGRGRAGGGPGAPRPPRGGRSG